MKLNFDYFHLAPPVPARTEVTAPPGVGPSALDAILESLKVMNNRQVRIETRLVRLMRDQGLNASGYPMDNH